MKVAITGGTGFIGGHVIDTLINHGHTPLIFDRHRRNTRPDVEVMLGDTRDETAVTELAAHADGIIHLASVLGTQETVHNPRPAVSTNVISGMNVFEAGVQYGLPVVNICVGNHGMSNPYSASKTCVETLGHMYVRDRGLRLNQVRAVNAYGPRQSVAAPYGPAKVRKIMPSFICRALTGAPIEVYGDGRQVSDCVWVGDVARVLVQALEAAAGGVVADQVVEIGPFEHHTVLQVAELVNLAVLKLGLSDRADIKHLPMRPGETPGAFVTADPSTLNLIGADGPTMSLEDGIDLTVRWYADNWLPTWAQA